MFLAIDIIKYHLFSIYRSISLNRKNFINVILILAIAYYICIWIFKSSNDTRAQVATPILQKDMSLKHAFKVIGSHFNPMRAVNFIGKVLKKIKSKNSKTDFIKSPEPEPSPKDFHSYTYTFLALILLFFLRRTGILGIFKNSKQYESLIIYGTTSCPWCKKQFDYLRRKGINYKFVDTSSGTPSFVKAVPTLSIDGKLVEGYTEL